MTKLDPKIEALIKAAKNYKEAERAFLLTPSTATVAQYREALDLRDSALFILKTTAKELE